MGAAQPWPTFGELHARGLVPPPWNKGKSKYASESERLEAQRAQNRAACARYRRRHADEIRRRRCERRLAGRPEKVKEADMEAENTLYALNKRLFAEMDRLEEAEGDALEKEIGRARALREVGQTIIANGNLMVSAAREMSAQGESVSIPKGLLGA